MKTYNINLILTRREIELLRNSTSDLGTLDNDCLSLQLKIANGILETDFPETRNDARFIIRETGMTNMVLGKDGSFSDDPFEWISFPMMIDAQNKIIELGLTDLAYCDKMK